MRRTSLLIAAVLLTACTSVSTGAAARTTSPTIAPTTPTGGSAGTTSAAAARPPAHIVVVMEENHSYGEIIGNSSAPYINGLARTGRSLSHMHATSHPSEPNYLALFSGSTHGITNDSCPHTFRTANLGRQLLAHHRTFAGYSEGLPYAGSLTCTSGAYARKHVPWSNFSNLPQRKVNLPFTSFPSNFANLPTVSFVVPNLNHDMHDGTIGQADTWLRQHLGAYARWAPTHNSQLIVTWDESDGSASNQVATIIKGAGVATGKVTRRTTAYSLLRLIESDYGLRLLGGAASAPTIPLK